MHRMIMVALLSVFTVAAFATTTPSAATLTPSNPTVTFSGGPFEFSNPSSPLGTTPPACAADTTCGQFALTVAIPPSDFNTYKARITVEWTNSGTTTLGSASTDYDVYVYSPNLTGTQVTRAASADNPEATSWKAGNGTWTIYVVPYDVAPAVTFSGSITLERNTSSSGAWPPNSGNTPVPPGTPRFINYHAPSGVADRAGEPSVGVNRKTEKVFGGIPNGGTVNYYGGFLPYMLSVTFDDRTTPAATTWKQVPLLVTTAPRAYGDPILFTDRDTGRTFVSQEFALTPLGSTMEFTDNDDAPFIPSTGSGAPSGIDHQTVGGGPYHTPVPSGVNPLYSNGVWYCSQTIVDAVCSISLDGGVTFGPAVPMYNATDCAGLHGHVKIGRDGTAYVPNRGCGGDIPFHSGAAARQAVAISEDNGITWVVRQVPTATTKGDRDPSVGIADDGTMYFAYQARDGHSRVAVSHDKGLTWVNDTDIGAALGIQNSLFHAAVAGDGPRAAIAFFGTETGGTNYAAPDFPGTWYLYIATTFDGGEHWVTQNATPGDPIQRGGICGSGACRNLLDFFDATIDKNGRVVVGYDDGCISGNCIVGTRAYGFVSSNDYTAKAVIARQASGLRMYSAYDSAAGADITPPMPPQTATSSTSCDGAVASDPAGDADHPLLHANGGSLDQVDITGLAFSTNADKTALTTTITVKNFTPQPITGSLGTFYYATWTSARANSDGTIATRTYATRVSVGANGAVVYTFGQYDQANDAFVGTTTPATGSFVTGPNGTVSVTVPLSLLGNPTIPVTDSTSLPAVIEPYALTIITENVVRFTQAADRAPNNGSVGASWAVCLPPQVVCIDDDDATIAYSDNWHKLGQVRMHSGNSKSDTVKLTVNVASGKTGKITYNYATSPKGGSAEVFIDGVSRGTISYFGLQGSTKSPALGASAVYAGLAAGSHTFELRNMTGPVYVDGFCFENATSIGSPTSGPGATSTSSSVDVPANAHSVSIVGESTGDLPIQIMLVDPLGLTLATSDNSSGLAVLSVPVSGGGTYLVKVINLSAGPVEVWTAATPNISR